MRRSRGLLLLLLCFLLLPAGAAGQGQSANRAATEKQYPSQYRVRKGETLMSIARRREIFNDPALWPLIYKANRDQIRDPRIIFPGQILSIPRNVTSEEMEEARRQAFAPVSPAAPAQPDSQDKHLKSSPSVSGGGDNQTGTDR